MANLSTGEVGIESNMKSSYQQGIYGPKLTSYFRVAAGGCLTVDWPEKSTFAITRISSDIGLSDFTEPVPPGPAMLMAVAIKPIAAKDFQHRFNGKVVKTPSLPAFGTNVLDARANPMCFVRSGFDFIHFHIPRAGLDDIAQDHKMAAVDTYRFVLGEMDLAMSQFAKNVLPHIHANGATSPLVLDHLSLLLGAHLLDRYAGIKRLSAVPVGGLAPWQMRRAQEMLRANLHGNIRVQQLARECELSASHFARSFKVSFGVSPIQWVIGQRLSLAKQLLIQRKISLTDVAILSGFSDQSAMTRTFVNCVGVSPGRWRREQLGNTRLVSSSAANGAAPVQF
jgi:AraC family transcriptional regulator